ncbi:MAG TPA: aminotransferase class I/II-fold pyridoxal phosphate-dependent enzyme [Acidimicrobiales bacterium]|nr:aminotransferase class I/II-fold pyridoxal phosphate-dependent enzyme [Acidimicrobiales bacterium]
MSEEIDAHVDQRSGSGALVVPLGTGEAHVATPGHIVEAAVEACCSQGLQQTTPTAGLPELRAAIAAKTAAEWDTDVSAAEVIVTSGSQQSALDAVAAVVDPGDEVLLPAPYWPSYPALVELARGRVVSVPATLGDGFKVTVEQLEAAVSDRTTALLFSSPCDPTGAVYSPEELLRIGEWAGDQGLWLIIDEIYGHLVFGGAVEASLPALMPSVRDRCIVLNGVAKAYAMTGWRVGWLVAPPRVVPAIDAFQSHVASHASNIAQAAALAALQGGLEHVKGLRADLDRRRLRLYASLAAMPKVDVLEPFGALYAFPSVESCLGGRLGNRTISTTLELAAALPDHAGVSVIPGEAFGRMGHLRVSFALSDEDLGEGIDRLGAALRELVESRG